MLIREKLEALEQIKLNQNEFHTAFVNQNNEIECVLVKIREKSVNHRGVPNSVLVSQKPYSLETYKDFMHVKDDKSILNMFNIEERKAS